MQASNHHQVKSSFYERDETMIALIGSSLIKKIEKELLNKSKKNRDTRNLQKNGFHSEVLHERVVLKILANVYLLTL